MKTAPTGTQEPEPELNVLNMRPVRSSTVLANALWLAPLDIGDATLAAKWNPAPFDGATYALVVKQLPVASSGQDGMGSMNAAGWQLEVDGLQETDVVIQVPHGGGLFVSQYKVQKPYLDESIASSPARCAGSDSDADNSEEWSVESAVCVLGPSSQSPPPFLPRSVGGFGLGRRLVQARPFVRKTFHINRSKNLVQYLERHGWKTAQPQERAELALWDNYGAHPVSAHVEVGPMHLLFAFPVVMKLVATTLVITCLQVWPRRLFTNVIDCLWTWHARLERLGLERLAPRTLLRWRMPDQRLTAADFANGKIWFLKGIHGVHGRGITLLRTYDEYLTQVNHYAKNNNMCLLRFKLATMCTAYNEAPRTEGDPWTGWYGG